MPKGLIDDNCLLYYTKNTVDGWLVRNQQSNKATKNRWKFWNKNHFIDSDMCHLKGVEAF